MKKHNCFLCGCHKLKKDEKLLEKSFEDFEKSKNKWMLKYSKQMSDKFGIIILHPSEMTQLISYKTVCEFNTEK